MDAHTAKRDELGGSFPEVGIMIGFSVSREMRQMLEDIKATVQVLFT